MIALGGPGVPCSAMRVRRLAAGELEGEERARAEAHLAGCARCQRVGGELAAERARLDAELPFDAFAAGVAERLARAPRRARPRTPVRWALAAGIALVAAAPIVLRVAEDRASFRVKGGAELAVYVRDGADSRALAPGEPVPRGAPIRVGVAAAGRRHAAVALVDGDGAVILYAGPATAGLVTGAFEWTGTGAGTLVAVLDDAPVDAAALLRRLAAGGAAAASPGGRAEVVVRELRRSGP